MQGIEILNKTDIMTFPDWFETFGAACLIIFVMAFVFAFVFHRNDPVCITFLCIAVASLLTGVISSVCVKEIPTGRYRYECLIDESVDFVDIYENYDVIERKGQIWILEDKEK